MKSRGDEDAAAAAASASASASEAEVAAATQYVGEYINFSDLYPIDLMSGVSGIRQTNSEILSLLRELVDAMDDDDDGRRPPVMEIQRLLVELQERNDDKIDRTQQRLLDPLEARRRSLDKLRRTWRVSCGMGAAYGGEKQTAKRVRRSMRVEATTSAANPNLNLNHHQNQNANLNSSSSDVLNPGGGGGGGDPVGSEHAPPTGKATRRSVAGGGGPVVGSGVASGTRGYASASGLGPRRKSGYRRALKAEANAGGAGAGGGGGGGSIRKSDASRECSPDQTMTAAAAAVAATGAGAIDPNEPTYCLCEQISFGEMILCDNDLCPIEWFHFQCVALVNKPKGKWYCPRCRGDKPTNMKPRSLFLKELEKYNQEKEEKADRDRDRDGGAK